MNKRKLLFTHLATSLLLVTSACAMESKKDLRSEEQALGRAIELSLIESTNCAMESEKDLSSEEQALKTAIELSLIKSTKAKHKSTSEKQETDDFAFALLLAKQEREPIPASSHQEKQKLEKAIAASLVQNNKEIEEESLEEQETLSRAFLKSFKEQNTVRSKEIKEQEEQEQLEKAIEASRATMIKKQKEKTADLPEKTIQEGEELEKLHRVSEGISKAEDQKKSATGNSFDEKRKLLELEITADLNAHFVDKEKQK